MDERKLIYADDAIRWVKIECNPYGKPTLDFESGKKVIEYLERLPSAQREHLVKKTGNLVKGLVNDCISRQAAIDAVHKEFDECLVWDESGKHTADEVERVLTDVPSAHPERMTNRQWIDFLSAQFDISRTSAKEMLHGMMQWKKEDNFKKLFNGGGKT